MRLFRKGKPKEKIGLGASDKVAGRIAGFLITVQRKFSDYMNRLFSKMSPGKIKVFLAVFCLSVGGYSFYLVGNALLSERKYSSDFTIDQVTIPQHATGDETIRSDQYVDEITYHQIIAFRAYMDSLKLSDVRTHDSIMAARPGLMDSVKYLEQLYTSQQER